MPRITFPCPNQTCPKEWDVEEKYVGKTVKCPVCNKHITVPSPHIPPPVISRPAVVPVPKPIVKPQSSVPIRNVAPHINPSPNASIPDLLKQAESGDAEAMLRLVYAYRVNNLEDFENAMSWLEKSANLGNAQAQFELSDMYMREDTALYDLEEGFRRLTQSAQNGYSKAKNNLAICYLRGRGTLQDDQQAFHWMEQASDDGHVEARRKLGILYIQGTGVAIDREKGISLLHEAASLGDNTAQELLNDLPKGTIKDSFKAEYRKKLAMMIVGSIIGAIIFSGIGAAGGIAGGIIGVLIGAYFGIGIGPFMSALKEEIIMLAKSSWDMFWDELRKKGFKEAFLQVLLGVPLVIIFWRGPFLLIRLFYFPVVALDELSYYK